MSELFLHITAGDGPRECHWVVMKLALAFVKEAKAMGLKADVVTEDDSLAASPSLLLKVKGETAVVFCAARVGTVKWIGQSPYRKNHKRKNWYVGVSKAPDAADVPEFNERDIRYQTLKASGPGGQHVNKTESAVRATHLPTGLTVTAQEERSQFANKRLTRIKIAMLLEAQKEAEQNRRQDKLWTSHKNLERGNEVCVYEGVKFKKR